MTFKWKPVLIFLNLYLLSMVSCSQKSIIVPIDFHKKKIVHISVQKYENSNMSFSWWLNLHPKDIILYVDVYNNAFGYGKGVDFNYMNEEKKLSIDFDFNEEVTC